MTPRAAALVTLVLLAGCGSDDGSAACAAPETTVSPGRVAVGDDLLVTGRHFAEGCYDTGQGGRQRASQDVPVVLEQDGRTWRLGSADAAEDTFELVARVRVPDGVQPGRARVRVGPARPVRVTLAAR